MRELTFETSGQMEEEVAELRGRVGVLHADNMNLSSIFSSFYHSGSTPAFYSFESTPSFYSFQLTPFCDYSRALRGVADGGGSGRAARAGWRADHLRPSIILQVFLVGNPA